MRLLLTALLVVPGVASAGQFYKCETADGATRYQDTPCAAQESESQPDIVENALDSSGDRQRMRRQQARERAEAFDDALEELQSREPPERQYYSYRCSAEGKTWFRHGGCPSEIQVADRVDYGRSGGAYNVTQGEMVPGSKQGMLLRDVPVQSSRVPRSYACDEIKNPGDRNGADQDSPYSTYGRNRGTDPCSPKYLK